MSSSRTETARRGRRCRRWASRVSEGTIVEWRKQPGDWVEADETIADVTTDKVDVEIPSPAAGRLAKLIAEPGETVDGRRADRRDRRAARGRARRIRRRPTTPAAPSRSTPDGRGRPLRVLLARRAADRRQARDRSRARSRAPGSAAASARRTCSPTSRRAATASEGRSRPLHTESPYRPDEPEPDDRAASGQRRAASAASRCRRCARRSPSTWSSSRQTAAHCTTIVEVDMSRVAARRARAQGGDGAQRGVPLTYLAFVAVGDGRGARAPSGAERVGRRRRARLPRRRQPRDRGRPRRGADRAGDPEGPAAQPRGAWRRRSPTSPSARARSGSSPTRSTAARSRSPTPASSARCSRRRSSTSRRWRSSTSRRSSSGRSWSTDEAGGDSIAIRPMTYLPMSWDHRALDGAEAARFLSRVKGRLEGWEVE